MSRTAPEHSDSQLIRVHQCISGFTQSQNEPHGVFKLSEKLHDAGYNNHVSRVSLRPWNCDWSDEAENIWQLHQLHQKDVIVNIYAYSWGCGWGAVRLADELLKRNVPVYTLVSCDGVYRHPNPLLRWTSLVKRDRTLSPVIRIPRNVMFVKPFHQTLNWPQGHRIVGGEGFSGIIDESIEIPATHHYMDEADLFHEAALTAAAKLDEVEL